MRLLLLSMRRFVFQVKETKDRDNWRFFRHEANKGIIRIPRNDFQPGAP